jgi:putative ABC transport system permease protein
MLRFISSLGYAWRSVVSRPAFSLVVIACLALGISVNTSLFAVFDGILWRPYDFERPEELVILKSYQAKQDDDAGVPLSTFRAVRRDAKSFQYVAAVAQRSMTITEGDEPERLDGASVSWDLFPALGIRPSLGRGFRADEDVLAAPTVVLISDALWRRRFAADSGIVGRVIQVNGSPHTVVGVMPPRFKFPELAELWLPLGDAGRTDRKDARYATVFARLRDGVTPRAAAAEYAALFSRMEQENGVAADGWTGTLADLRAEFVPDEIRLIVITMMGAVTFVLLIACANVANLTLARTSARQREIAIRTALGARRSIIVGQLLLESVILALVAGILSLPLAKLGLVLIDRGIPAGDPVPYFIEWRLDYRVLLYTVAVSILAGLAFGLLPAMQATSGNLNGALKEGGRGSGSSASKHRTRSALVVAEVALALVLLVGASLFVRSFASLQRAQVGFATAPLMTLRFFMQGTSYDSAFARQQRIEDVVRRVEALPGVQAATASNLIPLDGGGWWSKVEIDGRAYREEDAPSVWWSGVTAHWARTFGLELVAGRDLTESEASSRVAVAVIDEQLAKKLWPDTDALGRRFRIPMDSTLPWFTVVGVTRHIRQGQLGDRDENPASAYMPLPYMVPRNIGLTVRVAGDPSAMIPAIRSQIRAADSAFPVFDVLPMEEVRRNSYWQYALFGWMFGVFGAVALTLAAIGVYGVISYSVSQRTQEFGVRIALGADRRNILRMVVRYGLSLAGIGIAVGVVGAIGVTRVVSSLLVEVSPTDPASFLGVSLFLTLVAFAASYFPARRATAVDPIVALRAE